MVSRLALIVIGLALTSGVRLVANPDDLAQLLAYGSGRAVEIKVAGEQRLDGVRVQDVSFSSAAGDEQIAAFLVGPDPLKTDARPAGILFVHWFAPPEPNSNRTQFLEEATLLARAGVISLLPSTFWSDPVRYRARKWQTDFDNSLAQARNLRRALDVLLAQPGIDPGRIGVVGHDYGAMFSATIAPVETRVKAYVLIAGTARFPDWYLFGSSTGKPAGDDLVKFRAQFARIDPVSVLGGAKAAFFFQFGENDKYTPRDNFIAFYQAAPMPKRLATYTSDHDMSAAIIRSDRLQWLAEQLGLSGLSRPGD